MIGIRRLPLCPSRTSYNIVRRFTTRSTLFERKTTGASTTQRHQHDPDEKPISPHVAFYISFGKPLASVLVITAVTYVSLYAVKSKLQRDEQKLKAPDNLDCL
ncbi:hypothetical protein V1514DRAFT_317556 [Lipomyces japonicus]|uniref:uncharacterized protein n=1 Tax=Lipomyces japonicus TaxID=56871 RepID=UPI0034CE1A65